MACPNCGQPHTIKVNDSELYDDPFIHYEKSSASSAAVLPVKLRVERKVRGENGDPLFAHPRPKGTEFVQDIDVEDCVTVQ